MGFEWQWLLIGVLIGLIIGYFLGCSKPGNYVYGPFYIVDGDTVKKGDMVFRDRYMDTPEKGRPKKSQLSLVSNASCLKYYAYVAKNYTKEHLFGIYYDGERGSFGRLLGIFLNRTNDTLALEMVSKGLAFCYYREPRDLTTLKCLELEEKARKGKLGVWSCS